VQWSVTASPELRAATHWQFGTEVLRSLHTEAMRANGEGVLEVVVDRSGNSTIEVLQQNYQKQPGVQFSEINNQVQIQFTSNDPGLGSQWAVQNSGFGSKAVAAWDKNYYLQ
jgi:hypothetical protein